jgi:hypothetical protein
MITTLSEYISSNMTPGSEKKDYRASNITTFILSMAQMASIGTDRERGLPSFLSLARTGSRLHSAAGSSMAMNGKLE